MSNPEIISVESITATRTDGVYLAYISISSDGEISNIPFGLHPTDGAPVSVALRQWMVENPNFPITPYIPPAPLTPEEVRAEMPALTSRQFWMAAANIDIDKDVIITAIKAQIPDSTDRKMMIAELESSSFERLNPTIIDVLELMEIPAEQVDDLWTWASGI